MYDSQIETRDTQLAISRHKHGIYQRQLNSLAYLHSRLREIRLMSFVAVLVSVFYTTRSTHSGEAIYGAVASFSWSFAFCLATPDLFTRLFRQSDLSLNSPQSYFSSDVRKTDSSHNTSSNNEADDEFEDAAFVESQKDIELATQEIRAEARSARKSTTYSSIMAVLAIFITCYWCFISLLLQ